MVYPVEETIYKFCLDFSNVEKLLTLNKRGKEREQNITAGI